MADRYSFCSVSMFLLFKDFTSFKAILLIVTVALHNLGDIVITV